MDEGRRRSFFPEGIPLTLQPGSDDLKPTMNPVEPKTHIATDALLNGYHGRYLRVDVDREVGESRVLSPDVLRSFLGGTGLGVHLMLAEHQATIDPLSPDACLAFIFSPLVGSPLTTSAKFAVVCKSPLTHRYNDSLASSGFAITGKQTGYDAIAVRGRASAPSILVIQDDQVQLLPADGLWGKTTFETEQHLRKQLGPQFQFAVIGPAGEQQIRYATISHDGRHAGRGGSGAVLGAKRIKAIAVAGSRRCAWAQPDQLVAYAKKLSVRSMSSATAKYRELGTASNLLAFNRLKTLPTRNFQQGSFEGAEQISVEAIRETRERTQTSCAACTIGCEHLYGFKHGTRPVRMEYENLFALGSLCGVDDPEQILANSQLCDELGIDTISAGGTIAFAMECVERKLLDVPWLRFGDGSAVARAIRLIVARQGIGGWLAEGSRELERKLGPAANGLAAHVKGLELPGYEPRGAQTMALGFAVGTRGADHNRSGAYEADFSPDVDRRNAGVRSVELAIESEDRAAIIDSLILCKFLRGVFGDLFAEAALMLKMVCGWSVDREEILQTAKRIVTAKKLFNVRAGWQPSEDTLPSRFLDRPLRDDPTAELPRSRLESLVRDYNRKRGWSDDGFPTDELLHQLQLNEHTAD